MNKYPGQPQDQSVMGSPNAVRYIPVNTQQIPSTMAPINEVIMNRTKLFIAPFDMAKVAKAGITTFQTILFKRKETIVPTKDNMSPKICFS
jgi:hypothetical protein